MTDLDEQLRREERMKELGRHRARRTQARHEQRGEASETPAGIRFCKTYLEPLAQAIETYVREAMTGRASRKQIAATYLDGVDPKLAAYLTVRAVVACAAIRLTLKATAQRIAKSIESELLAQAFEDANTPLFKSVMKQASARNLCPTHKALALARANKHFQVTEQSLWTSSQKIAIGTRLIELCQIELGLVDVTFVKRGRNHYTHELTLKPNILEWYLKHNEAALLARPLYMPTRTPPKDWSSPRSGGFESISTRLLSRHFKGHEELLAQADMAPVYRGINGLQRTPWRINERVYEVMRRAWDEGLDLPGIPKRDDEPVPSMPEHIQALPEDHEDRKAWRRSARLIHERNAKAISARFEMARAMDIAAELQGAPFHFPHRLDFRGRVYAMTTSLNPQGSDEMRSLLEFAEGVPLGERGVFWLGVHGANLFGNDKVSLEDRYQWARQQRRQVAALARDPLANLWWTEADKPWSFLAWCFEWAEADRDYVSRLPIALDGSCNGIQHFSAVLRDPVGGAAVNLVPQDKPNDIYQRVADRVNDRLRKIVDEGGEDAWIASGWLQFGITRKITKRPVMVVPYGGTFKSCQEYVAESVREAPTAHTFGADTHRAVLVLARLVWASIGDVVIAARAAMDWLQKCARVANANGLDLEWTTPSGFRCLQAYRKVDARRVQTTFHGSIIFFTSTESTDVIEKAKNASAIAPNFVHSMDASALMLTIGACLDEGITSFAMIHDSYGTHAGRTDDLARILRQKFVQMYTDHDVLAEFRDTLVARLGPDVELPPLPERGSLDLNAVLESDYFFA